MTKQPTVGELRALVSALGGVSDDALIEVRFDDDYGVAYGIERLPDCDPEDDPNGVVLSISRFQR